MLTSRKLRLFLLLASVAHGWCQPTASVEGTVVELGSGRPMKDVTVGVASSEPGSQAPRLEAITDAEGRYRIEALEAGRYSVAASKTGYISLSAITFVGRASNRRQVRLASDQHLKGLDFSLGRAGAIDGTVVDADGQPVLRARISALSAIELVGGRWVHTAGQDAQTDDRGHFRIYDLPEGRYYVRAAPPVAAAVFRADGKVQKPPKKNSGFLTTYYPGVEELSQAVRVTVRSGQETPGIDLRLLSGEVFSISGAIALPPDAADTFVMPVRLEPDRPGATVLRAPVDRSGEFRIASVPPGLYRLRAFAGSRRGLSWAGSLELSVSDRDITDVKLLLAGGSEVHGTVRMESDEPLPANVSKEVKVFLMPAWPEPAPQGAPAALDERGRFTFPDVAEGDYWVRILGLPDQYYVKRTLYGKTDLGARRVFRLVPGIAVKVEISAAAGSIRATVRDAEGQPLPWAVVVAFRDEGGGPGRPWRTCESADQHGVAELTGIAPGSYRLYAFDSFDQSLLDEFDYSQHKSVPVKVEEKGRHSIDLDVNEFRL